MQNLFMWNMVSFLLFYIGISISMMSFDIAGVNNIIYFLIIGFVLILLSYFIYISIYAFTQNKKLRKEGVVTTCECGGTYQLYMKDLIIQFWFVSIFIYVIVHFIFQFAFILYESYIPGSLFPSPANDITMILIFLISSVVLGIVFALGIRKKLFIWQHHKSPKAFIRTFQVFFIVIMFFMVALSFNQHNIFNYNHVLIYQIVNNLSEIFPIFVLNVCFYLLLRKEFGKHENSLIKQLLLGFVIIILPYFIWLTTLLFIQNYWILINYGAISGFIFGMLLILGIFNIGKLMRHKIKSDIALGLILILIGTPFIVYIVIFFMIMELIPYLLFNFVILIILTIICYVGLHVEFFQRGNETIMLEKMNKIDYPYYILLGFFFMAFFTGLETLFNSVGVISNGLFQTNSTLNLIFVISFLVGLSLTFMIKRGYLDN